MARGALLKEEEKAQIKALKEQGHEMAFIKIKTGRSFATIYKVLREGNKENEAAGNTAPA